MRVLIYQENIPFDKLTANKKESRKLKILLTKFLGSAIMQDRQNTISVNSKTLQKEIRDYRKYIDILINAQIIRKVKNHRSSVNSTIYSFYKEYWHSNLKIETDRKPTAIEVSKNYSPLSCYFNSSLEIDIDTALHIIKAYNRERVLKNEAIQKDIRSIFTIHKIYNKDFFFKVDKYGRVHTNLTNCPKKLKKCITYGGEALLSIDINNTQPLLLFLFSKKRKAFKENLKKLGCSIFKIEYLLKRLDEPDFKIYGELVLNGNFYEYMIKSWASFYNESITREEAKKLVLILINDRLNPSKQARKKMLKLIEYQFPTLFLMLKTIKEPDYKNSSKLLQTFESKIVIKDIAIPFCRQYPEIPLFTIHDCLVTTLPYREILKSTVMNYFFEEFQEIIPIKIEEFMYL